MFGNSSHLMENSKSRGPHGLGDPDDTRLRKVEKNVLIQEKLRMRARHEYCCDEVEAFSKCSSGKSLTVRYYCKELNDALRECLRKSISDPQLQELAKQEYLEERRQYRLTGIPNQTAEAKLKAEIKKRKASTQQEKDSHL